MKSVKLKLFTPRNHKGPNFFISRVSKISSRRERVDVYEGVRFGWFEDFIVDQIKTFMHQKNK